MPMLLRFLILRLEKKQTEKEHPTATPPSRPSPSSKSDSNQLRRATSSNSPPNLSPKPDCKRCAIHGIRRYTRHMVKKNKKGGGKWVCRADFECLWKPVFKEFFRQLNQRNQRHVWQESPNTILNNLMKWCNNKNVDMRYNKPHPKPLPYSNV
jgi:hypothetical protein